MQFKALGLLKDAGIPALDILSLEAFREYRLHNSSLFPPGYLLDDFQERYGSLTPAERLMAFTVELAARHGMHSPVTLAMQFLGSVKTLRDCLDDSQFLHAIAMAEVWRAFHFEIFGEHKLAVSGHKVREGAKRGGRQNSSRDVIMARKFQQRRNKSELSDTALKVKIGAEHRLTRSAGINAINRGLKKIVL